MMYKMSSDAAALMSASHASCLMFLADLQSAAENCTASLRLTATGAFLQHRHNHLEVYITCSDMTTKVKLEGLGSLFKIDGAVEFKIHEFFCIFKNCKIYLKINMSLTWVDPSPKKACSCLGRPHIIMQGTPLTGTADCALL